MLKQPSGKTSDEKGEYRAPLPPAFSGSSILKLPFTVPLRFGVYLPPMSLPSVMLVRQTRGQGRQTRGPQALAVESSTATIPTAARSSSRVGNGSLKVLQETWCAPAPIVLMASMFGR